MRIVDIPAGKLFELCGGLKPDSTNLMLKLHDQKAVNLDTMRAVIFSATMQQEDVVVLEKQLALK